MTNKQIRIHDVDVSGCSWYTQGATGMICADWHISNDCSKNPNCYYKQLKRKEQECEELKKIIDEAKNSKLDLKSFLVGEAVQNEYEQQLDQLKADNKELKRKNARKRTGLKKKQLHITQLKVDNEELKTKIESLICSENCYKYKQTEKYKKALQEIKEIATENFYFLDCDYRWILDKILQKISEVENG